MADQPKGRDSESFTAGSGRFTGIAGIAIAALVVIDVAIEWRTREGLLVAAVAIMLATIFWIGLVRPAVVARQDGLVLRNFSQDVHIPWHLIDSVALTPVLTIEAGGELHQSVALAASRRDRRAAQADVTDEPTASTQDSSSAGLAATGWGRRRRGPSAAKYAYDRLRHLADERAKDSRAIGTDLAKRWAVPELAVLAGSLLLLVVIAAS